MNTDTILIQRLSRSELYADYQAVQTTPKPSRHEQVIHRKVVPKSTRPAFLRTDDGHGIRPMRD